VNLVKKKNGLGDELKQWFSKCVSWMNSISFTWALVTNASFWPHCRTSESEMWGRGAQQSVLTSLPGNSYAFSGLRITSTGSYRYLNSKSDELC